MLFVIATFGIVFAIVLGSYWLLIAGPEAREQNALRRRLKAEKAKITRLALVKDEESLSEIGPLNALLSRFTGFSQPAARLLEESGLPLNVGTFVLGCIAAFMLAGAVAQWYLGIWWVSLLIGLVGGVIPYAAVRVARTRRLRQFEEQFPEAVELIARSLRAGHAFATGLKMTADELPAPAGPEFKLLFERQNYGAQLGDAMRSFAERIPLVDARFFVTAVMTQRETGGNLAEVLDRLASVMRERFRIRREVRVKSAHGRITAFVLAGMPPAVAVMITLVSPEQMQLLITDPIGIRMVAGAAVLQIIGTFIVRKLVDIQY